MYLYFSQWRDSGDWQRLYDTMRAQVRQQAGRHKHPTAGCVDSQSVKTTELGRERGYDTGKNVNLLDTAWAARLGVYAWRVQVRPRGVYALRRV